MTTSTESPPLQHKHEPVMICVKCLDAIITPMSHRLDEIERRLANDAPA